jgi:hypothetical protein
MPRQKLEAVQIINDKTSLVPVAFPLKAAATYSGLTVWHLRQAIWHRKLTARLAGKRLIVLRSDLDNFVSAQPVVASGPYSPRKAAA